MKDKSLKDLRRSETIIDSILKKNDTTLKQEYYLIKLYILCKNNEDFKAKKFFSENAEKMRGLIPQYITKKDSIKCGYILDFKF
jgi:hypothetical protein